MTTSALGALPLKMKGYLNRCTGALGLAEEART